MLDRAWTYSPTEALAHYLTNPKTGLDATQVRNHRELYGENGELPNA
jgi:Ca2+ transporting ATPase